MADDLPSSQGSDASLGGTTLQLGGGSPLGDAAGSVRGDSLLCAPTTLAPEFVQTPQPKTSSDQNQTSENIVGSYPENEQAQKSLSAAKKKAKLEDVQQAAQDNAGKARQRRLSEKTGPGAAKAKKMFKKPAAAAAAIAMRPAPASASSLEASTSGTGEDNKKARARRGTAGTFCGRKPPKDPVLKVEFDLIRDEHTKIKKRQAEEKKGEKSTSKEVGSSNELLQAMKTTIAKLKRSHPGKAGDGVWLITTASNAVTRARDMKRKPAASSSSKAVKKEKKEKKENEADVEDPEAENEADVEDPEAEVAK